ncbi:MAG: hypothetical protein NTW64_00235, partial [Candidatus Omnitrophica bacterium]|nr:hypothetical protein [Candidatus Omnitrophota bacterium]
PFSKGEVMVTAQPAAADYRGSKINIVGHWIPPNVSQSETKLPGSRPITDFGNDGTKNPDYDTVSRGKSLG